MDLDKYIRELKYGKSAESLKKLTESEAGASLAKTVDVSKLETAAQQGDMKTLSAMLKTIMATPEGRSFAAQVERAVKGNGR